ncbi:Zn-dependent hydrolase [Jeotgalibacillus sp. JSM ZJ347]|uniref:Zn-dependent hydrolase n=1 Tax=Jeotgalibacillus sp. JSM ZJ347 TaxID=3342117 RepID=UPI0035A86835
MKDVKIESPEFKRIMKNLHLENLSLNQGLQEKVLETINADKPITPSVIKDLLSRG